MSEFYNGFTESNLLPQGVSEYPVDSILKEKLKTDLFLDVYTPNVNLADYKDLQKNSKTNYRGFKYSGNEPILIMRKSSEQYFYEFASIYRTWEENIYLILDYDIWILYHPMIFLSQGGLKQKESILKHYEMKLHNAKTDWIRYISNLQNIYHILAAMSNFDPNDIITAGCRAEKKKIEDFIDELEKLTGEESKQGYLDFTNLDPLGGRR